MFNPFQRGPKLTDEEKKRVPPGQSVTEKWPVLHYGAVPRVDLAKWDFKVYGLLEEPVRWTYEEIRALPTVQVTCDIHCVTRWSKLDNVFEGVSLRELAKRFTLKPEAKFVLAHCEQGFTANLPVEALFDEDVLLAWKHNGEDLAPEHGWPLRLVVPRRYFWKSAKWIRSLEFLSRDRLGFWEQNGYSNNADPWKEERFW
jgi:DMSO/TMAO reductase YedYZ molybdopterin-dependent catalytic subunit